MDVPSAAPAFGVAGHLNKAVSETGFTGAFSDHEHQGCTFADEVKVYGGDTDLWADPKVPEMPLAMTDDASAQLAMAEPAMPEPKMPDGELPGALTTAEEKSDYPYEMMRLDDPYALPMREGRKDGLPELDNDHNASFSFHGANW